ncbi:Transcription initiation factor TFIID subunit 1 [Cucumispora dikerogammari]|nr:Transcription initiation factor TFIID subunit 1 [Cucumispora dikerogammari]
MDLRDFLDNTHESSDIDSTPRFNHEIYPSFIPQTDPSNIVTKDTQTPISTNNPVGTQRELNFLSLFTTPHKKKFKLQKYRILSDQTTYTTLDYLYYKKKYLENKEYTVDLHEMFDTSKNINVKRYLKQKEFEKSIKKNFPFKKPETPNKTIWDYRDHVNCIEDLAFKNNITQNTDELVSVPVSIVDWEKNICNLPTNKPNMGNNLIIEDIFNANSIENKILSNGENIKNIKPFPKLFENDPFLVFDSIPISPTNKKRKMFSYNLSKDELYNLKVDGETFLMKRGSTHIREAIELSDRIFPSKYSTERLRDYHRETRSLSSLFKNNEYKLQTEFKKDLNNSYVKLEDLGLADNDAEICLVEYLEQYPLLVQKPGMVSILESYYRKTNKKSNIPNAFNLESGDPSPFLFNIKPNSTVHSLSNNLFKAPVFKHDSANLFVLIFPNNETNILTLKKISDLRLAGQVFPSEEVYSPNTRKFGAYCKNRLKVDLLNTLLYDKTQKTITLSDLDRKFPHFTEGQKRRLLREFCIIYKKGKENIYVLNENIVLFRNDVLRLCTPENVCQHEGLLYGEQKMKDMSTSSNSSRSSLLVGNRNNKEGNEEDDHNLSPWILSKNYINSKKGRGMLELSGAGDPSRNGICISFEKSKFNRDLDPKKYSSDALKEYRKTIDDIFNKMEITCSETKKIERPGDLNGVSEQLNSKILDDSSEQISSRRTLIIRRTNFDIKLNRNVTVEEKISNGELIDLYLAIKSKNASNKSFNEKKPLKCGACGELGHMKTSKKCIKFIETAKKSPAEQTKSLKSLNNTIINCLNTLCNMKAVEPFIKPVPRNIYPQYYEAIERPISLSDMKQKAKNQSYKKFSEFEADIELMKNNCFQFNGEGHSLSHVVVSLSKEVGLYKLSKSDSIYFNEQILS